MNTMGLKVATTEYVLPASEALLVAVLALVTGHAQSQAPEQRACLAAKVAACLQLLGARADLSPALRQAIEPLGLQWSHIGQCDLAVGVKDLYRRHPAPVNLQ